MTNKKIGKLSLKSIAFCLIPTFVLLFLLEGFFRLTPEYPDKSDPVSSQKPEYYLPHRLNPSTAVTNELWPTLSEQVFPMRKPEGGYRIFAFGGSTVADLFKNYPDVFLDPLRKAHPGVNVEFITAGSSGFGLQRSLDVAKVVAERYDPDLFLVYAGENEFNEKSFWSEVNFWDKRLGKLRSLLRHSAFLHRVLPGLRKPEVIWTKNLNIPEDLYYTGWLDDPEYKRKITAHYENLLEDFVSLARKHDIDLFFSSFAYRMRGYPPKAACRRSDLSAYIKRQLDAANQEGGAALSQREFQKSKRHFEKALEIDPENATALYGLAETHFGEGQFEMAADIYRKAANASCWPVGNDEMNVITRTVAQRHEIPFVDAFAELQTISPHEITGEKQFTDTVHLNPGHVRVLMAFLAEELIDSGLAERRLLSRRSKPPTAKPQ